MTENTTEDILGRDLVLKEKYDALERKLAAAEAREPLEERIAELEHELSQCYESEYSMAIKLPCGHPGICQVEGRCLWCESLEQARAEERERCAQIAEGVATRYENRAGWWVYEDGLGYAAVAQEIRDAIREEATDA